MTKINFELHSNMSNFIGLKVAIGAGKKSKEGEIQLAEGKLRFKCSFHSILSRKYDKCT